MANQRKKTKKVVSIPMEEALLKDLELEAARRGVNRTSLVNEMLTAALKAAGKLTLLAAIGYHALRSGNDWSTESMWATLQLAGGFVAGIFS